MITEHLANRDLRATFATGDLPSSARVVIVGGGIVGASVAYHLVRLGVGDVVVLERGHLTNGTTWHAAGLVAQVRGTHALTELSKVNADVYERLPAETGVETGFRRVGALTVARTEARMQELLYAVGLARDAGVPAEVLEPADVKRHWPPAAIDDVVGGTLFPTDGTVNPGDAALALATGANAGGATFVEGVRVTGFRLRGPEGARVPSVEAVVTDRGVIECDHAVVAAGLWSSEVARMAGVSISLFPAEHVWVMTKEAPGAEESLPILRDLDGYLYVRHYRGRYVIGAFEPRGKPRAPAAIDVGGFVEFGADWDHFAPVLAAARQRLPELEGLEFEHYLRAPESFTPDSNFHLGETPEVRRLYVAAGFNSQGIIYAPGAGAALAEWIVEGRPTRDLAEVDVARSGGWQNNRAWLGERTGEMLGRLYAMHWPGLQPATARGVRRTPLWDRLDQAGAVFGEAAGWERANWFAIDEATRDYGYSFDRPNWFAPVGEEGRAAREGAALFDLSTYSKFMVEGAGALAGLQRLFTSDLDVPCGRVVYTLACNERGGIEMDPTVTRLGEDRFLVAAPTLAQRRTEMLLRAGLPREATVTDVTSGFAVLLLTGPRAREVLSATTDTALSNEAFPFMAAREADVAWARAWLLRLSYVGELGWELWVPTEFAADLHDKLVAAGAEAGMRHAGFFAFDALRLERGFRSWGHDMGPLDDPFAAGLGFAVAEKDADFVGREALKAVRGASRTRRLVSVRVAGSGPTLWHGESVLVDGERRGFVTSGAFGPTLNAPVGLAWIESDEPITQEWLQRCMIEVEIRGEAFAAEASLRPYYDPGGVRLRS
ncbi:MAG TPA: FAD-dependent oxidoreductase [Actinomycetota bacterium]|nr:FAD-dependent oxidoreductase [Actinomycetota bacterium]